MAGLDPKVAVLAETIGDGVDWARYHSQTGRVFLWREGDWTVAVYNLRGVLPVLDVTWDCREPTKDSARAVVNERLAAGY